jgi:hypothetical protein
VNVEQRFHLAPSDVYLAPYTQFGHRVYYAVDSAGELMDQRIVPQEVDPQDTIDDLWLRLQERNERLARGRTGQTRRRSKATQRLTLLD